MKKKIILFAGIIIQMIILQTLFAISLDNKNHFPNKHCVHERQYSKAVNSNSWIFVSGKTTKYFFKHFDLLQKANDDIPEITKLDNLNKKTVLITQGAKPNCSLNLNSELFINFNGYNVNQILIFDVLGNLILNKNNSLYIDSYMMNFSEYSTGYYYIKVITDNNEYLSMGFVKI